MISTAIRRATAKKLRANTTPRERALWRALKELPVFGTHFRRQAPIGPYVVDFFCPAAHLIIELDGGHHNDDEAPSVIAFDSFGSSAKGIASSDFGIRKSTAASKQFWNAFMLSCTVRGKRQRGN